jgi:hypothetical protein
MHLCIESLNMAGGNQQCAKKRRGIQKAHATVGSNICKKRAPRAEECAGKKQQRAQKAIYATRNGCMLTGRVAPNLSHIYIYIYIYMHDTVRLVRIQKHRKGLLPQTGA